MPHQPGTKTHQIILHFMLSSTESQDLNAIQSELSPSEFDGPTQLQRNAKSLSARQQMPHHL